MALTAPIMKKSDHVRTIFDCFAQDDSFKDVVFLVEGEQLSYHSQILRNVFPFLKNFLPNPGSFGPWDAFMSRASSIVITLDCVSPTTVSSLMSSIYNQQKPIYFNKEETEKVKELLEMLGADSRKYNLSLNTSMTNSSLQTKNMETEDESKTKECDGENEKVDRIGHEELLLNENINEAQGEGSDTVNEADIGDWQRDGSCSSTVPQEDEASDLDESVEDEEITFSIDASQLEADEHLPNHDDATSSSSHQELVQDSGASVLSMVEEFMNEDVAVNLLDSKVNHAHHLASENASNENQVEFNENDIDEDIEVIAEVVDGVTEVVHEASQQAGENVGDNEASQEKVKEPKFAVEDAERVDLEVVIEEQFEEIRENKGINSPSSAGSLRVDNATQNLIIDELTGVTNGKDSQFEVNEDMVKPVNQTLQDSNNEDVEENCQQLNTDEQSEEILHNAELESSKESNEIQINDQSDDDDFIEDEDDELIEDEEDEEMNVACAMENEVPNQDMMDDQDNIPAEDAEVSSRKRKLSEDDQSDENQKKEKFAKSSPIVSNTEAKSDDSDDEDFDLESLSAPLEDVERVKRDLSESFELENEDHSSRSISSDLLVLGDKPSNVKVSFKGDDLEMMTDISTVEKKISRILDEDHTEAEDDETYVDEDPEALSLSLSDEDGEVDKESSECENISLEKKSTVNQSKEEDKEAEEAEVEKTNDTETNHKMVEKEALRKTKVDDESSEDGDNIPSGNEDSESIETEESNQKRRELGNCEIKEKESSDFENKCGEGVAENTKLGLNGEGSEAEVKGNSSIENEVVDIVTEGVKVGEEETEKADAVERAKDDDVEEELVLEGKVEGNVIQEQVANSKEVTEDLDEDDLEKIADDGKSSMLPGESLQKDALAGEDGLQNSKAGVDGEDLSPTGVEGSAKEDNEEDADLLNIDEDDVDMLNEQTEHEVAVVVESNKKVVEKNGDKCLDDSSVAFKVNASSEDSSVTTGVVEPNDKIVTETFAAETDCSKSEVLKSEPSPSALEPPKPAPTPTPVSEEMVAPCDPPVSLSCPMCPTQPPLRRGQLLTHLTDKHYSRDLQQRFPWTEGASCQMCVDTSRAKVTISKTKATYAKHVGTVHEKVLDLVPAELKEAVLAVSKTRKSLVASTKEPEVEGLEVVGVQKQELVGGNEVNTIKEECVDNDSMEVEATSMKEVTDPESIEGKVIEAKGLKSGQCPFCPNTKTQFQRSSLLNHLSSTHYNKQLLDAFPYQEGETCKLCVETGRQNPLIAKSKPRYINHMGSLHEKVLDLLPPNVKESLESKKVPARTTRKSVSSKDIQDTSSLPSNAAVPGPSSSRGTSAGPSATSSTRAPAPGPPGPPLTRSLPKSLTVSAVPEDRLTNLGNVSISKVKEKKVSLPKLANVSISKIE